MSFVSVGSSFATPLLAVLNAFTSSPLALISLIHSSADIFTRAVGKGWSLGLI